LSYSFSVLFALSIFSFPIHVTGKKCVLQLLEAFYLADSEILEGVFQHPKSPQQNFFLQILPSKIEFGSNFKLMRLPFPNKFVNVAKGCSQ